MQISAMQRVAGSVAGTTSKPKAASPSLPSRPAFSGHVAARSATQARTRTVSVRASAESAVQQRWDAQVRDGRVRNISTSEVKGLLKEGWTILDVRPPTEVTKAAIQGAVTVPLFVPDPSNDFTSLVKKATDFGMGSWWLGGTHYIPNTNFLPEVQSKVPKDARVIVACQKGLRSLAACEQLSRAGYQQIAWINGGLDTARKGDIDCVDGVDIRYGGIGGLSEVIGWTEVQRENNRASFLGGLEGVIKLFSVILAADLALFVYEQVKYWQETGTGPFGN